MCYRRPAVTVGQTAQLATRYTINENTPIDSQTAPARISDVAGVPLINIQSYKTHEDPFFETQFQETVYLTDDEKMAQSAIGDKQLRAGDHDSHLRAVTTHTRHINCVGCRPGGCQGRTSLRQIAHSVMGFTFFQLNFDY
uniref:Uncharacterized protein n=1 Tax=Romanomermis culicivorax TaxID=13658 RepID=A0A915KFB4_ROMCU